MPRHDDRTLRGLPLPHVDNILDFDVERLREAITTIDADITKIESTLQGVADINEFLSTRMEVIVGEATEDTEILDARVDAEGNVHPNLGHNIRSIHSGLLQAVSDIKYSVQEFQGLLHQFNELAEAQIQGELNSLKAHEHRQAELEEERQARVEADGETREALVQESLTRAENDSVLQTQVDELAEGLVRSVLTASESDERRKQDTQREAQTRAEHDALLQRQIEEHAEQSELQQTEIDNLTEAALRDAINLSEEAARRVSADNDEAQAREIQGEVLQAQVDDLSHASLRQDLNIHREAELRREGFSQTNRQLDALQVQTAQHKTEISDLIDAMLRTSLNLHKALERGREALNSEAQTRAENDAPLQAQTQQLSEADIRQSLTLSKTISSDISLNFPVSSLITT